MTAPTPPPHEDDLRTALHEAEVGVDLLRRCVELKSHDQPCDRDWEAAVERIDELHKLAHAGDCVCRGTGRIGNDIPCLCSRGDSFRAVPVGKPVSEVTG